MKTQTDAGAHIAELLRANRDQISTDWIAAVNGVSRGRLSSNETKSDLLPVYDALMNALLTDGFDQKSPAFDEVRAMLAEYSSSRARKGFTPSETAVAVFALRDAALKAIDDSSAVTLADFAPFSTLIDDLGLVTFENFARTRETIITSQTEQLLELSTPVVKLWDGVLAVPLVGTLDSARAQVVMEELLQALVATGSSQAIIDITGVPAVDTQVAQHLLKTAMAARLMGADCIISGIRPQIAQTIVALGIEFGEIATKSTLAEGLRMAMHRLGFETRKTNEKRA